MLTIWPAGHIFPKDSMNYLLMTFFYGLRTRYNTSQCVKGLGYRIVTFLMFTITLVTGCAHVTSLKCKQMSDFVTINHNKKG